MTSEWYSYREIFSSFSTSSMKLSLCVFLNAFWQDWGIKIYKNENIHADEIGDEISSLKAMVVRANQLPNDG